MKKRCLAIVLFILLGTTACSQNKITGENGERQEMKALPISLSDMLSSKMNRFELQSGNYELRYMEGKELTGVTADGRHPLDQNMEKEEKLKLPAYNGTDTVTCLVSCDVAPDRLTVKKWDVLQAGDMEAAPEATEEYTETSLIELKPGKIYEITAEWKEKNLDTNGFYGTASYAVITE